MAILHKHGILRMLESAYEDIVDKNLDLLTSFHFCTNCCLPHTFVWLCKIGVNEEKIFCILTRAIHTVLFFDKAQFCQMASPVKNCCFRAGVDKRFDY